jgi:hypothetical protein
VPFLTVFLSIKRAIGPLSRANRERVNVRYNERENVPTTVTTHVRANERTHDVAFVRSTERANGRSDC